MELRVSVPQIILNQSNLNDKNTGAALREQTILLMVSGKLSGIEAKVLLRTQDEPLAIGNYDIAGDAFGAGRYGSVDFKLQRQHLKPLASQQQKAA